MLLLIRYDCWLNSLVDRQSFEDQLRVPLFGTHHFTSQTRCPRLIWRTTSWISVNSIPTLAMLVKFSFSFRDSLDRSTISIPGSLFLPCAAVERKELEQAKTYLRGPRRWVATTQPTMKGKQAWRHFIWDKMKNNHLEWWIISSNLLLSWKYYREK